MPALAEPISHYTDAVRAATCSSSRAASRSTARASSSAATTSSRRRGRSSRMSARSSRPRARVRRRRQGHRLPDRRRRPGARSTRSARRSSATRARPARSSRSAARHPGREARGRGGRAAPMTDAWNAVITEVEPARRAAGPAARQAPARQGSDRHRRHPHDVRLEDLRRPRAGRTAPAVAAARRRRRCARRQGEPARVRLGRDEPKPLVRDGPESGAPGKTTGGSSGGNAAALAAGLCDIGLGTDTGCSIRLPPPAAISSA